MLWFEELRQQFEVTQNHTYVNIAFSNPLAINVLEAMNAYWQGVQGGSVSKMKPLADVERVRSKIAQLINTSPKCIAFTKNTSEGLNIVAQGLSWRPGDNVIVNDQEHPNNVLPWLNLRSRGVDVKVVRAQGVRLPVDLLWSQVDEKTKVIALSYIQFGTGYRADLAVLGARCREAGIKLVVDAIQGVGTFNIDVEAWGVDALACGGFKGMLGPHGIGFVYCASHVLDQMTPVYAGTSPVVAVAKGELYRIDLKDPKDARRLECGTLNYAGVVGLEQGIDLINRYGQDNIEERVLFLSQRLSTRLKDLGYDVISPPVTEEGSGLIVVTTSDPQAFLQHLRNHKIIASLMDSGVLRFSPYAFNLVDEMEYIGDVCRAYKDC